MQAIVGLLNEEVLRGMNLEEPIYMYRPDQDLLKLILQIFSCLSICLILWYTPSYVEACRTPCIQGQARCCG
jgi:hypothetical protein